MFTFFLYPRITTPKPTAWYGLTIETVKSLDDSFVHFFISLMQFSMLLSNEPKICFRAKAPISTMRSRFLSKAIIALQNAIKSFTGTKVPSRYPMRFATPFRTYAMGFFQMFQGLEGHRNRCFDGDNRWSHTTQQESMFEYQVKLLELYLRGLISSKINLNAAGVLNIRQIHLFKKYWFHSIIASREVTFAQYFV